MQQIVGLSCPGLFMLNPEGHEANIALRSSICAATASEGVSTLFTGLPRRRRALPSVFLDKQGKGTLDFEANKSEILHPSSFLVKMYLEVKKDCAIPLGTYLCSCVEGFVRLQPL